MKKNLRGKIREFMQSEEGKVGIKSPLTLGVATGGILLAQTVIGPSVEAVMGDCKVHADCPPGYFCREHIPIGGELIGTCM